MAQQSFGRSGQKPAYNARNIAVAVPQAGNTVLLTIPCHGLTRILVQVDVTVQALDAFIIQVRSTNVASLATLYSVAGDYTSPKGLLVGASGDLTTIAAAASGWFIMDVDGLYEVVVSASSANVAGSTVDAYCGGGTLNG